MEVLQKESVQRDYELRILRFCRNELTFLLLFYVLNFRMCSAGVYKHYVCSL